MRHSTEASGAVLGGGKRTSQVADLELRLLRTHSAHVEYELSALSKCHRGWS